MRRRSCLLCALLLVAVAGFGWTDSEPTEKLCRPAALTLSADGAWLYTANRQSGSISVIDPSKGVLAGEIPAGKSLADLVVTADRNLLAVDELAGELLLVSGAGVKSRVTARLGVGM